MIKRKASIMTTKSASAFEGFETFTNEMKMIIKMHLCILVGCLLVQVFALFALWDFRSYDNRLMLAWYKAQVAASMPMQLKVAYPTPAGGRNVAYARDIVRAPDFINYANHHNHRYLVAVAWSFCAYLLYPLTLLYFRRRAGDQADKAHLRGTRLIDPKKYRQLARKRKAPLDLPMGSVRLPLEAETSHMVMVGKSGCGKTNAVNQVIERLRERGERAVIYDSKGDFISSFYNPDRDLIFNPLDRRSVRWSLFNDVRIKTDITAIAASQIPAPGSARENPFWKDTSRKIFDGCLRFLKQAGHTTNRDIWEMIQYEDESIRDALERINHPAAKFLKNPKSDTSSSIISTLMSHLDAYEHLAMIDGDFSITDWVREGDGFLFISSYSDIRDAMKPLISLFIDQITMRLLSLPEYPGKKTFFILEELWTLQRLPSLLDLITQSRSKGGGMILSVQEPAQLDVIYGASGATTIFNNAASKLIFGCAEPKTARYCSQFLGEEEVLESSRSYTLGVNEFKDGVNISQSRSRKDTIMSSEITQLEDLNAFFKANNYPPLRTTFDYIPFEEKQVSFEPSEALAFAPPTEGTINPAEEDFLE
jgi:type IV conjugative transfer system coupling protein TraD